MWNSAPDSELAWKALAQRSFQGLPCPHDNLTEYSKPTLLKTRIQKAVDIYDHAVAKMNTVEMWSHYLDFVMEMYSDLSFLKIFKRNLLLHTLESAGNSGNLPEKYYPIYLDKLRETNAKDKKIREVLKQATDNYPSNYDFWEARLLYHIRKSSNLSKAVFMEAITSLEHVPAAEIVSLWRKIYLLYVAKYPNQVIQLFYEGFSVGGRMLELLRPLFIEHIALTDGIGVARLIFEDMVHEPCLALFQKMAELEGMQPVPCMNAIRRCFELACTYFGQDKMNIWVNYVKFELTLGEVQRARFIHYRATRVLNDPQLNAFLSVKFWDVTFSLFNNRITYLN